MLLWKFLYSTQAYLYNILLHVASTFSRKLRFTGSLELLFTYYHAQCTSPTWVTPSQLDQFSQLPFICWLHVFGCTYILYVLACWRHTPLECTYFLHFLGWPPCHLLSHWHEVAGERFTLLLKVLLLEVIAGFEKGDSAFSSIELHVYTVIIAVHDRLFHPLLFSSSCIQVLVRQESRGKAVIQEIRLRPREQ